MHICRIISIFGWVEIPGGVRRTQPPAWGARWINTAAQPAHSALLAAKCSVRPPAEAMSWKAPTPAEAARHATRCISPWAHAGLHCCRGQSARRRCVLPTKIHALVPGRHVYRCFSEFWALKVAMSTCTGHTDDNRPDHSAYGKWHAPCQQAIFVGERVLPTVC